MSNNVLLGNTEDEANVLATGGRVRTIGNIPEAEAQLLLDAVEDILGADAKKYALHNIRTNWGLVPTIDDYASSYGADFDKEGFFAKLVQNHNVSMGRPYSVLGLLRKETPAFLPFDIVGDFFSAINLKGKVVNHDAILKKWDKDRDTGKTGIHKEANDKHYQHRYNKTSGSTINETALTKYITDAIKKSLGGYKDDIAQLKKDYEAMLDTKLSELASQEPYDFSSILEKLDEIDRKYDNITDMSNRLKVLFDDIKSGKYTPKPIDSTVESTGEEGGKPQTSVPSVSCSYDFDYKSYVEGCMDIKTSMAKAFVDALNSITETDDPSTRGDILKLYESFNSGFLIVDALLAYPSVQDRQSDTFAKMVCGLSNSNRYDPFGRGGPIAS